MRLAYLIPVAMFVFVGCGSDVIEVPYGGSISSSSSSSSSTGGGMGGMGGSGGSGGTGGIGGTGGMPATATPECVADSDCVLINDCCRCAGAPKKGPLPECPITECFAATCDVTGLAGVAPLCVAGRCVVDADCNQGQVQCNTPPFACPPGKTIHIVNGCWGGCIDPHECKEVGTCAQCPAGQACIENVDFSSSLHCVEVPSSCNGSIDCDCVGASSCVPPYSFCVQPAPAELRCECINC